MPDWFIILGIIIWVPIGWLLFTPRWK